MVEGTIDESDRTGVVAIHFKESPPHSSLDWHAAPEAQYVITLSGTLEFTTRDGETFVLRPGDVLVAISFGVFALYCVALPALGFRIATFAYVVASNALLAPPRGWKGWAGSVILGLATALVTWLVFERYLSVLLPRGRWTQF